MNTSERDDILHQIFFPQNKTTLQPHRPIPDITLGTLPLNKTLVDSDNLPNAYRHVQ